MHAKRLSDRNFGLMFAIVFSLIAVVVWLLSGSYQYWAAEIAVAFFLVALVCPAALMPLNRLWERLGHRLGLVSNAVLLGTFYYLMITPFGVAMRLISTDPMRRRTDQGAESYFTPVGRQANRETFPDMF